MALNSQKMRNATAWPPLLKKQCRMHVIVRAYTCLTVNTSVYESIIRNQRRECLQVTPPIAAQCRLLY